MTKIADIYRQCSSEPLFICDFSPPRGAAYDNLHLASALRADCLAVPYNPGKSVYANSAIAAYSIKSHANSTGAAKEVSFTIATRDMNILAVQSLLLGAALLELQNIIIVRGDDFTPAELRRTKPVNDHTTTTLIRSVSEMNRGIDFRGRTLSAPTDFCIGASIDTNRSLQSEVSLARSKIEAGADFFITQPDFTPEASLRFLQAYENAYREKPPVPIFFGVQMVISGSRSFTPIPKSVSDDLAAGVSSSDIAIRAIHQFISADITTFYLMPPILYGGARDYQSAQAVLAHFKIGHPSSSP